MNDLDAAQPEWRVGSAVTDGNTLRVAVGSRQFIADQLLSKVDIIRAMHERVQLFQGPQTELALLRESLGVSRINHILRVHGHTILEGQSAAEVYDEIGQLSLELLFPGPRIGQHDTSNPQRRGSKELETSLILHTWELSSKADLGVIETATSTYLSALDSDEQATAKLYVQKAAQAADEAWQQTTGGLHGSSVTHPPSHPLDTQAPPPKMKPAMTWTSQRPGRAYPVRRSSKRSFHDSLIGLVSGV